MKQIRKLSELIPYEGFTNIQTAFLVENDISPDAFQYCFPEYGQTSLKLGEFLKSMPRLKYTNEFIDFVKQHKDKHFVVVGDYDCDGVFSTLIMVEALRAVGCNCDFIVPHKFNDGYGLQVKHIEKIIEMGGEVIITVDNGISCKPAVDYALEKGLAVAITDHHLPSDNIPENVLVIDPKYNDDAFSDISGGFVALKLANDLIWEMSTKVENEFNSPDGVVKYQTIDKDNFFLTFELAFFAAITTVSDLMPLINENRLLLKSVFTYVNNLKDKNVWAGRIMKVLSGLGAYNTIKDADKIINEDTLKYYIGPTTNAVGRVDGDVEPLIQDILDVNQQGVYLKGYFQKNMTRKQNTRLLLSGYEKDENAVANIAVYDPNEYDFPIVGLTGLIASRLSSEGKVSMVGFEKDGRYEFSCRSVRGYSIFDGINRIKESHPELLLEGGGHALSMGVRFTADLMSLETFKEALYKDIQEHSEIAPETVFEFEPEMIDELIYEHQQFGLFGGGFKKLNFIYRAPLISFDAATKTAQIGDFYFKTGKPETLKIDADVEVEFTISLESKSQIIFKAEKLHWDQEDIVEEENNEE